MPCSYSYLQVNFYKRFDGAVSTFTVYAVRLYSKNLKTKLRVRAPVKKIFLIFSFSKKQDFFCANYMFAEKACFGVLCTCQATSLSKMARLVWRYSDDAGAIIENVYKFCMEEKKYVTESCMGQGCSTHWR